MQSRALNTPAFLNKTLHVGAKQTIRQQRDGRILFQDVCWMIFCISLMCESIPIVTTLRLFTLAGAVGLMLMVGQITQKDARRLGFIYITNTGMVISVIAGGHADDRLVTIIARAYIICPYAYLYLAHRGLGQTTLVALALGMVPQLFVYLTGNTFNTTTAYTITGHQFCGTVKDPNFLCSYLVIALGAQLALLRNSRTNIFRILWLLAAIISMFLIVITLSRAGTGAMFLAIAIFGLTLFVKHPYVGLAVGVIVVSIMFGLAQVVCQEYFPDAAVGRLYARFKEEGDASVFTNDRYDVLWLAYKQITESSPMAYHDDDEFVAKNKIAAHNTPIQLALLYGWLPASAHIMIWGAGIWMLLKAYCRKIFFMEKQPIKMLLRLTSGALLLVPYFFVVMTIPAAGSFIYWFALGMVILFACSDHNIWKTSLSDGTINHYRYTNMHINVLW